jgi:rare lipoprotein A
MPSFERSPAVQWGTRCLFTAAVLLTLSVFPTETATRTIDLPILPVVHASEISAVPFAARFRAASSTSLPVPTLSQTAVAAPAITPRIIKKTAIGRFGLGKVATELSGMASWYGNVLENHKTASGRRFHSLELTAAHRTLPFGSKVLVTDLRTHRTVVVTITDRGELFPDRVIDLSLGAAKVLDIVRLGTTPVRLQVLSAADAAIEEAKLVPMQ